MALRASSGDSLVVQQKLPPPPDPEDIAAAILAGFDRHYALFRYCAQRAKTLFENGDWHGLQRLNRDRIEYYDARVRECVTQLAHFVHAQTMSEEHWQATRQAYCQLLAEHDQPECAETFFNSVSCRLLHRDYYNNRFIFVRPAVASDYLNGARPAYRSYYPLRLGLRASLTQMLADFGLATPFANLPRDVRRVVRAAVQTLKRQSHPIPGGFRVEPDCQIQVLRTLFFRNKAAYLVGRFINGNTTYPFALPLLHNQAGEIVIDALLFSSDDLALLFSFTRAYFLVDMEVPSAYVHFLSTLLTHKSKAEFYTVLGLQKQGKTLFYRDFLHHLEHSHDSFVIAPGIKGMVMCVFTLPSYPYVFKVVRDRILKEGMTRALVEKKYRFVKQHDRVGRLADTWEYSQVALPLSRFHPDLLAELQDAAPSIIEVSGDTVILRHVYIERRMTPLNLYLQRGTPAQVEHGIREYGNAIRDLTAANIFPGDLLFKNFGVTRLGRVVFYDYDEIQAMTEMNFRRFPAPPHDEADMASEPWFPVHPNDVFPEEFSRFLLGSDRIRSVFMRLHANLFDADWWNSRRAAIVAGRLEDVFPFDASRRFSPATTPATQAGKGSAARRELLE